MDKIALGGGLMLFGEGDMLGRAMKFKRDLELGVRVGVACNDVVPFRGEGDGAIELLCILSRIIKIFETATLWMGNADMK